MTGGVEVAVGVLWVRCRACCGDMGCGKYKVGLKIVKDIKWREKGEGGTCDSGGRRGGPEFREE